MFAICLVVLKVPTVRQTLSLIQFSCHRTRTWVCRPSWPRPLWPIVIDFNRDMLNAVVSSTRHRLNGSHSLSMIISIIPVFCFSLYHQIFLFLMMDRYWLFASYGYLAYNIWPDPDFCWIRFFYCYSWLIFQHKHSEFIFISLSSQLQCTQIVSVICQSVCYVLQR